MHTTNYLNTLIEVSEDCPSGAARIPSKPETVAGLQHRFLSDRPGRFTSDELLAAVAATRQGRDEAEWPEVQAELFTRGQACLRSSPLVKTYGWGIYHDAAGRVSLVSPQSAEYQRLHADPEIVKTAGMRSKRA